MLQDIELNPLHPQEIDDTFRRFGSIFTKIALSPEDLLLDHSMSLAENLVSLRTTGHALVDGRSHMCTIEMHSK